MKVTVDQPKCVSAGNCVAYAPDVFDQDEDDGSVILLEESPAPDRADDVRQAAETCPAHAIFVQD
jgi:ferredoxin